jgi:hypothetical protein
MLAYFASVLMFPDFDKEHDLKNYFLKNFRVIGVTMASFILVNLFIALALGSTSFWSATTVVRIFNPVVLLIVSLLDLKKWIIPVGVLITITLAAGIINFAME